MTEFEFIEVSWHCTFKVWWSLLWRTILFSFLAIAGVGFISGLILDLVRLSPDIIKNVLIIVGYIVFIPISIAVTKAVLNKNYSGFRVALISTKSP